jgi:adenylate cyclase
MSGEILRFADFELDRGAYELRHKGNVVQLERIPLALLFLLASRPGQLVTRQQILDEIWGKNVFIDVENSINTAVRKLRRALDDDANAPHFVATVPAMGYRFLAPVRQAATVTVHPRPRRVLVVLPFTNLSGDPQQEYLSDGLTEETVTGLGRMASDEFGVIARTSAMSYKNTAKTIAEIGAELGADFALEGSVRRHGNRLRISAQLIRTSDQIHLWADNYDRDLRDVLSMQAELGRAVGREVRVRLSPASRPSHPVDPDAYDAYLRGRYQVFHITQANIERGIEHFRQSLKIDPHFAAAYAGIADAYERLPLAGDVAPGDAFPKAEDAARKALAIDPVSVEAHTALGVKCFWFDWNCSAAEKHLRAAIANDVNDPIAHQQFGHLLSNLGRHDDAIAEIELARRIDPLSLIINSQRGQFRYHARRYEEAEALYAKARDLNPDFWPLRVHLARLRQQQGRHQEALAEARKAVELSGGGIQAISLTGAAYAAMGEIAEAEEVLNHLVSLKKDRYVAPYRLAMLHLALGRFDRAFELLEEALRMRDINLVFIGVEPRWDVVRENPRFRRIAARVGLWDG